MDEQLKTDLKQLVEDTADRLDTYGIASGMVAMAAAIISEKSGDAMAQVFLIGMATPAPDELKGRVQ